MKPTFLRQLFSFVFLLFIVFLQAQEKDAAKLIREGNHQIFQNPVKAKEIADQLYNEAGENIAQKINALLIKAQADGLLAKYDSSLQYALEAKDLSEKLSDESYRARVYAYLGYHYYRVNAKDKAWNYIDIAEKIIRNYSMPDSLSYLKGNIFFTKASMYQKELDCTYAISYFSQAIKVYKESIDNEYANINLGLAYSQKGHCELELNKLLDAEESFRLAISNSEKNEDIRNNIFAWTGIARVDALNGNYIRSNEILKRELSRAQKSNLKHMQNEIYKFLSYNYLKLKDTKSYELCDSLYKETQSEFSKTEAGSINHIVNDASHNKHEKKSLSSYLLIGVAIIILLLFIILFIIYRIRNMKKRMKNTESKDL